MTKVVNLYKNKYDIYIGRGSIFGNPFIIGRDGSRIEVIYKYNIYFNNKIESDNEFKQSVLALKGKILGCFCKPKACHGDIICNWLN